MAASMDVTEGGRLRPELLIWFSLAVEDISV